ncbi:MAG: response regulator [Pseudobdellovibrio sp.]
MNYLVVDDELLIRKSLARVLTSKGFTCFEAENGQVALDILAAEKVDAIILDLIMPIKSGYDVISEMSLNIPIFIISAFTGPELSSDYLKSDARIQFVLKKPFENLFAVVEKMILQSEAYYESTK